MAEHGSPLLINPPIVQLISDLPIAFTCEDQSISRCLEMMHKRHTKWEVLDFRLPGSV
ncbi:hypothetical protein YC2023_074210 [Brassica napus]